MQKTNTHLRSFWSRLVRYLFDIVHELSVTMLFGASYINQFICNLFPFESKIMF